MFTENNERWTLAMVLVFTVICLCIFGCETRNAPPPPPVVESSRLFSSRTWPTHTLKWLDSYTETVEKSVAQYAPHLLTYNLTCPNSKTKVWLGDMFRAAAYAESSYNPRSKMTESSGIDSLGLMQMSYSDGKNYGFAIKDLFDPIENITVAVRVMGSLTKNVDASDPCAFYRAAGRYWATFRTPSCWNPARLQAWTNTTKELGQCQ